jgi:glycoprotein 3-alpha-L-fucosyltransferase
MGARPEDYAASLPPHSYIHVDDFRSPHDLADYLHVLDSNETLYNEYFAWKTGYTLANHSYWCLLCGLLHVAAEQRYVHWYPDYRLYWDGEGGSVCSPKWSAHNGYRWQTWQPQDG